MDKLAISNEKMEENEFVNYSPMIFKRARELCLITESSYIVCVFSFSFPIGILIFSFNG